MSGCTKTRKSKKSIKSPKGDFDKKTKEKTRKQKIKRDYKRYVLVGRVANLSART